METNRGRSGRSGRRTTTRSRPKSTWRRTVEEVEEVEEGRRQGVDLNQHGDEPWKKWKKDDDKE